MPQGRGASKSQQKKQDEPQGPPDGVQIPMAPPVQIIRHSQGTEVERLEDGGLKLSFLTMNGMTQEIHTRLLGEPGKDKIKECVNDSGLITDVSMADIEAAKEKQE